MYRFYFLLKLIIIFIVTLIFLSSKSSAVLTYKLIQFYLPGEINIGTINGSLLHGAIFNDIKYSSKDYKINIKQATLDLKTINLKLNTINSKNFALPEYGIFINNFDCDITIKNYKLYLKGQLQVNNNQEKVYFDGNLDNININGNNIIIEHTAYNVILSPNLNTVYDYNNKLVFINGEIKILSGKINLEKFPENNLIYTEDIVLLSTAAPPKNASWNFLPNIKILTMQPITVTGKGINTMLTANIIIDKVHNDLFAIGKATLTKGTFSAIGQKFYITNGFLLYPPGTLLQNPQLDIKLLKANNKGLYVYGTANKPQLEDLGLIDSDQNQAILQAITSSTSLFVGKIQNKLGLELGVTNSNPDGTTSWSLGKQISDSLYLQYSKSMAESDNNETANEDTIKLKYQNSPNWDLGVESNSKGYGVDLGFKIEKD